MLLVEALAELGLDLSASSDDVRRAYLKLLKTRKPEQDPDGFKRLREAYEVAKSGMETPSPIPAAAPPVPLPAPAPAPAPDPLDDPLPVPVPVPVPVSIISPPAGPSPVDIAAMVANEQYKPAAEALMGLMQQAETRSGIELPPERFILWLGCRLMERKSFRTAKNLETAFQRWLTSQGTAGRMGAASIASWSLFRDFVVVGHKLSDPVRRSIGLVLREPGEPLPSLSELTDSDWNKARDDLKLLRKDHPSLHDVVAGPLATAANERWRDAQVEHRQRGPSFSKWGLSLPVWIVIALLRVLSHSGSCGSSSQSYSGSTEYRNYVPPPPPEPSTPHARAAGSANVVSLLACGGDATCEEDNRVLQDALRSEDCKVARVAYAHFVEAHGERIRHVELGAGTLQRLEDSLAAACPRESGSHDE